MEKGILEILASVNKEVSWDSYLDAIEEGVDEYQKKFKHNKREAEQHLNKILPKYWEVIHTHNIYRRCNGSLLCPAYDVGIFLVGFSTIPIVLSLAEIQPRTQVYFLYSEETEDMLTEIDTRINILLPNYLSHNVTVEKKKIERSSDPVQTFKQIKEVIDKVGNKRIALDLTGGKKTMLGGGFTAGSILGVANSLRSSNCDMFYVDSLDYDRSLRAPKPGSEFLSQLENPYDVYNVQSVQQAEKLFEEHNYEAAADLWYSVDKELDSYAKRFGLENEQISVKKDFFMADCYANWDAFDYINARDCKRDYGSQWDYDAKHVCTCNTIDVLNILSEVEDPKTLFAEEARIIHYAVDRYQNGIRRMESARFDDAIVRFMQIIEILCRYQTYLIAENNCLTDENHDFVSVQCCLEERWKISQLIHFLFRQHWQYDRRYNIANEDMRLDINDYDYHDTDEIIEIVEARNDFVHVKSNPGWEEMKESAENLQDLALTFLTNFYGKYYPNNGLTFDNLLELHRFHMIRE